MQQLPTEAGTLFLQVTSCPHILFSNNLLQSQGSVLLQVLLSLLLGASALFGGDQTPQTSHEE